MSASCEKDQKYRDWQNNWDKMKKKKKYIMQKVKQLAILQLGWVFSEFLGKVVMGQSQEFWDLGFQASQRPEKGQKMQYPGCTYH